MKKIGRHELTRMLIKLNDDAAIKKFSEFDYFTIKKSYNYDLKETEQQVLGVRVIKPDGRIVEVSTDEYMTTREGKKGDQVSYKLAVPGLEKGDILDLFTYEEKTVQQRAEQSFTFPFVSQYPMLRHRVKCTIDDKLIVQYRTLNGAPQFAVSTDKDKNTILEAEVSNVEAVTPGLWYNAASQAPVILLHAFDKSNTRGELKSVKKGERVQSDPDFRTILVDAFNVFKNCKGVVMYCDDRHTVNALRDKAKSLRDFKDKEDCARYLHNALMYYYLGFDKYDSYSKTSFVVVLSHLFDLAKIPYSYLITTDADTEPLDQLIVQSNATWGLRVGENSYFVAPEYECQTAGTLPADLQGRLAAITDKFDGDKTVYTLITLPRDSYNMNNNLTRINAEINGMDIDISRTETRTGTTREVSSSLITMGQMMDAYDRVLKNPAPFVEQLPKKERTAMMERLAKEKEEQFDLFKKEVEVYHDMAPAQFKDYAVLQTGLDPQAPQYVYTTRYTLDGLVKKAGPNLVVSVGKLLGAQVTVEGEERNRDCDVYRSAASSFDTNIYLELPQGYTVTDDNLAKLKADVANGAASFRVTPTLEGNTLHLLFQKTYFKAHYPLAEWNDLLKVVDAASDYTNRQIILKSNR